jgi:predicted acyl esterase
MKVREDFPRRVRLIPHVWIPLSDGSRLAARIWLPEDADADPVPALLEYIPYRKNDATATRDAAIHPYFAGFGYASVRVDIRGSGDSDGILLDEYLQQELDDGCEVIAWLAAQPWCTGAVGMFGKSWGGFNSLQVAALAPPALRAVISVDSTDDRYADDVHYMGGCLLGSDMLSWASTMLAYNARPPDPAVVGERWREAWFERMEQSPPFVEAWVSHQRRDDFWRHGSVCEDFSRIRCPVYMIGGWNDAYRNAVFRVLAGYDGPRKGLIGPWSHNYPHQGIPGPAIGFLQDALRWWDHWLKGLDTGVMDEPMLRVWMQDWVEPRTFYEERPGRWVAEDAWPSARIEPLALPLGEGERAIRGAQESGLTAGAWCPGGDPAECPPDQRAEDGRSLCFHTGPLERPLEILGFPEAVLTVAADRRLALVVCRLCDVAPDGSSLLVTRGLLNLAHRDGDEEPTPLQPGRRYQVCVRLNAIAHRFPAGHKVRLAVSPTYFPWAWPSPEPVTLTVDAGSSRLELPERPPAAEDAPAPFEPPEFPPPLPVEVTLASPGARRVSCDLSTGRHELVVGLDHFGTRGLGDGLVYSEQAQDTYSIVEGDPLSAEARSEWTIGLTRGEWSVRVETRSVLSGDAERFHIVNSLDGYEGAHRVFARTWSRSILRDLA